MSKFLKSKLLKILSNPPAAEKAHLNIKAGFQNIAFGFCHNPTTATTGGNRPVPSIAAQITLVGELLDRNIKNNAELARVLKDSTVTINNNEYSLSNVLPMADKVASTNREPTLQTRLFESFNNVGAAGTGESLSAAEGLDRTWINTLKHTQSLESLYLHIDNAPFANIIRKYTEKPGNLIMYEPTAKSTEGSLGHGQRTVILGKETTSPQGFIQSARLMCGDRIDNILTKEQSARADSLIEHAQFEQGRRVLDAMPVYQALEKQIKGRTWEDKLINQSGLQVISEAKVKLQNMRGPEQYRAAAFEMTKSLGKEALEAELDNSASPTPI